jgi:ribosomal protein S18 acetylase RimI-like enzyme
VPVPRGSSVASVSNDVVIEILERVTPQVVAAFARLIPQLSSSSPPPTAPELQAMVDAQANDVLVAMDRVTGDVLGSLTLVTFRIPTGIRSWIEDVVVDDAARGRGVGEALNRFALDLARSKGAKTVDLTSRPTREAANRLYQRMGFQARNSNLYRYDL